MCRGRIAKLKQRPFDCHEDENRFRFNVSSPVRSERFRDASIDVVRTAGRSQSRSNATPRYFHSVQARHGEVQHYAK
jgi:hypothetical protein